MGFKNNELSRVDRQLTRRSTFVKIFLGRRSRLVLCGIFAVKGHRLSQSMFVEVGCGVVKLVVFAVVVFLQGV